MSTPLKVLLVEDSEDDAHLLVYELRRANFIPTWQRVETEPDFIAALNNSPDLVISDFSMPHFSGLRALKLLRSGGRDTPFILVSGTVGEDIAVEAMRIGATDYLLKDRIIRLGNAVERALEQKRLRDTHRQLEMEIAARERRLNDFFTGATAGLALLDKEFRFLQINRTLADINGVSVEAHLGRNIHEVLPKLAPLIEPSLRQVLESARPILDKEIAGETPKAPGVLRHWTQSFFPVTGVDGKVEGLGSIVVETTAQKQAMAALRDSEEKFRQLAENIHEVFWITNPSKNQMLYISPAYETIWGRSCESLYQNPRTWLDAIHPDDRPRILNAAMARQKEGNYDETYRIVRPDGSVRWIRDRAFPLRNPSGEVYRIVGTAEDVTQHRLLEEQVRQSQKMEAIGLLSSGIAHDFNNILAVILMQVGLCRDERNPDNLIDHTREIERAAQRAADLTRQLLLFSRKQAVQPRDLDLNEVVRNLSKMLRRAIGEDIQLQFTYSLKSALIHADPGMLEQVLLNLSVNSRDAMPNGGELQIKVDLAELAEPPALQSPQAHPGHYVRLTVSDTGCGIPPELLPRIFEPFFTTKDVGKGTGLGLATVFGIVQQHHGWIDVQSQVGSGTAFTIHLPALDSATAISDAEAGATPIHGGKETILVVEDEPQLRMLMQRTLGMLGYHVIVAANGVNALEVWALHRASVALLITDMVMPGGISGRELGQRLLQDKPDLKIIYTSGYSADLLTQDFIPRNEDIFLAKPFASRKLAEVVRTRLDAQSSQAPAGR